MLPEKHARRSQVNTPPIEALGRTKKTCFFSPGWDHPRWKKKDHIANFLHKIYIFMIMGQPHPPCNFSLDDEYVTVFNFTPDLTLTRFRYMDASSEVQAPSVVRSRQGGGTDVI